MNRFFYTALFGLATTAGLHAAALNAPPLLPNLNIHYIDQAHHLAAYTIDPKTLTLAKAIQGNGQEQLVVVDNKNHILGYVVAKKNAIRQILVPHEQSDIQSLHIAEQIKYKKQVTFKPITMSRYLSSITSQPTQQRVQHVNDDPSTITTISELTTYPSSSSSPAIYNLYNNGNEQVPIQIVFNQSSPNPQTFPAAAYKDVVFTLQNDPTHTPIPINGAAYEGIKISTTNNNYEFGTIGQTFSSLTKPSPSHQTVMDTPVNTFYISFNPNSQPEAGYIQASINDQYTDNQSVTTGTEANDIHIQGVTPPKYTLSTGPSTTYPYVEFNPGTTSIYQETGTHSEGNGVLVSDNANLSLIGGKDSSNHNILVPLYNYQYTLKSNNYVQKTGNNCNLNNLSNLSMTSCQIEVSDNNYHYVSLYFQDAVGTLIYTNPSARTSQTNLTYVMRCMDGNIAASSKNEPVTFSFQGTDIYGNPFNVNISTQNITNQFSSSVCSS